MRISPTGNSLGSVCLLLALAACGPGIAEVKRLRDSCQAGDPAACNEYGQKLLNGTHVLRDDSTAGLEFARACEGNIADGCARLAVLYQSGRGFKKDSAKADGTAAAKKSTKPHTNKKHTTKPKSAA